MTKISAVTKKAIISRLEAGEDAFFIGAYYYEADYYKPAGAKQIHRIRRREQAAGRTPTSDWEVVCWDNEWEG